MYFLEKIRGKIISNSASADRFKTYVETVKANAKTTFNFDRREYNERMKLSLHRQDEQTTLLKAKLPISVFNHPFSSIFTTTAANSISDLSLSLSTAFPSGPSLKLTYTPSSSTFPPFSLSLKSGLGFFGSPNNSPLVFSASLSPSAMAPNSIIPTFSLQFKPQLGHFSFHKKTSSTPSNPNPNPNPNPSPIPNDDYGSHSVICRKLDPGSPSSSELGNGFASDGSLGWQELKLEPCAAGKEKGRGEGYVNFTPSEFHGFLPERQLLWKDGKKRHVFLSGFGVMARTVLPLTKSLVVNLRWGANFPGAMETRMPYLTLNKIGIERITREVKEVKKSKKESNVGDVELLKGMCFWMRRDLEVLEKENRGIKQSLEDMMRYGVSARNSHGGTDGIRKNTIPAPSYSGREIEQRRSKKNGEGNPQRELKKPVNQMSDLKPVSQMTDLESELQRAIKAAST